MGGVHDSDTIVVHNCILTIVTTTPLTLSESLALAGTRTKDF